MKKFYLMLAMLLVSMVAFAQNVTVTIVTDDTEACQVQDPATYQAMTWDAATKSVSVTLTPDNYGITCTANPGYSIVKAVSSTGATYLDYPAGYMYIERTKLTDGETITVTTAKKQPKIAYIKADPSMVSVKFNQKDYTAADQVDGQWMIDTGADDYATINVNAFDGYRISSVKNTVTDQELCYYPTETVTFTNNSMVEGDNFIEVTAYDLAASRTSMFTVEVEGDVNKVQLQREGIYKSVPLAPGIVNEIAFNPETELPISISSSTYGTYLYQVTLNGTPVARQGSSFSIEPANGDAVKIYTEFPEGIKVPVKISFANEGTEDAISQVIVNNSVIEKEVWSGADFTVDLGSTISLFFNSAYESSLTANGDSQYFSGSYSKTIIDEAPMNFVVTATKLAVYKLTVNVTDPSHISGKIGSYPSNPMVFNGTSAVFEVPQQNNRVTIIPSAIGIIKSVTTNPEMTFYDINNIAFNMTEDVTIDITTEEFVRDLDGVIYLEQGTSDMTSPNGWTFVQFVLNSADYNSPHRVELAPQAGYNFFNWAEYDKPFALNLYPGDSQGVVVYLDGEKISAGEYSAYPALSEFKDKSVIKIYEKEPQPLTVTNEIQNGVEVEFTTDYYTTHENNVASLTVLPGTYYTIKPLTVADVVLSVTANDVPLEAIDGVYATTINADTKIIVSASTAIGSINADSIKAQDVYNLQGIRVKAAATPDDIKSLPAGLYIVGGKKIMVR